MTPAARVLPACDSKAAYNDIQRAIENGPDKTVDIKMLNLEHMRDYTVSNDIPIDPEHRQCFGVLTTNAGEERILYDFKFKAPDSREYIISVQPMD